MAARWATPKTPSGAVPNQWATDAIHHSSTRVGDAAPRPRLADRPDGQWTAMPASSPPVAPTFVTGPAAGTASRLAGMLAEAGPRTLDEHGCDADLRGERDRQRPGQPAGEGQAPGERAGKEHDAERGADGKLEADRPDEQRIDEQQTRDRQGEQAQARRLAPTVAARVAKAAMAVARSTDGSKRVTSPKNPSTVTVAMRRAQARKGKSAGPRGRARTRRSDPTARRWTSRRPRTRR